MIFHPVRRAAALSWFQTSYQHGILPTLQTVIYLRREREREILQVLGSLFAFVKPSDSLKARVALQACTHDELSVEAFASKFKGIANRIVVGNPVDKTTQASPGQYCPGTYEH